MAKENRQKAKTDMQAMMEVYKKLCTPGVSHKMPASMAGRRNTRASSCMEPGKPPIESTGTSEQKIILVSSFLSSKSEFIELDQWGKCPCQKPIY
jgi:hypothetical protein